MTLTAKEVLRAALARWPQAGKEEPIDACDMVDWFNSDFLRAAKAALERKDPRPMIVIEMRGGCLVQITATQNARCLLVDYDENEVGSLTTATVNRGRVRKAFDALKARA